MNNDLIYIYNLKQAKWMIENLKGKYIYRIGTGAKGDILITFISNEFTLKALKQWKLENPNIL